MKEQLTIETDYYTLPEIKDVLSIFLDETEVEEALIEFKKYKDNDYKIVKVKVVEDTFILLEKFCFNITPKTLPWIDKYSQNVDYIYDLTDSDRLFCYPIVSTHKHLIRSSEIKDYKEYKLLSQEEFEKYVLPKYPLDEVKRGNGLMDQISGSNIVYQPITTEEAFRTTIETMWFNPDNNRL